jgi:hypothetical protein
MFWWMLLIMFLAWVFFNRIFVAIVMWLTILAIFGFLVMMVIIGGGGPLSSPH